MKAISDLFVFAGNCYSKVRDETKLMQESMDTKDFHFKFPQKEVKYVYKGEDSKSTDEYIVEVDKPRPDWWPKNLLTKSNR